jgi:hypothetical protein
VRLCLQQVFAVPKARARPQAVIGEGADILHAPHQPAILRWHVADTFFGCGGAADPRPVLLSRLTLAYLNGLDGCPASSLTGGGGFESPNLSINCASSSNTSEGAPPPSPELELGALTATLLRLARPRANRCPLLLTEVAPTLGAGITTTAVTRRPPVVAALPRPLPTPRTPLQRTSGWQAL